MKTKLTLLFALLLLLPGCEWLKKAGEVTISTNLIVDIPIVVGGSKSANLITEVAAPFNGNAVLSLDDNPDIENYLDKIREITLQSVVITVTGLTAGQAVTSVTVEVSGVGVLGTQTNISSTNNSFTPAVNANIYGAAEQKLLDDQSITVVAYGNATGEPMSFIVTCNFTTDIVAGALD
jgi:hypothetical protein